VPPLCQAEPPLAADVQEASLLRSEVAALRKQLEEAPGPEVVAKVIALEAELAAALDELAAKEKAALQTKRDAEEQLASMAGALQQAEAAAAAAMQAKAEADEARAAFSQVPPEGFEKEREALQSQVAAADAIAQKAKEAEQVNPAPTAQRTPQHLYSAVHPCSVLVCIGTNNCGALAQ